MELLLNIVWLLVALAALARCATWASGQSDRKRVVAVALATACMVALLFPIISITDDLHDSVAVLEESAALRRTGGAAALQHAPLLAAAVAMLASLSVPVLSILTFTSEKTFSLPSSPAARVLTLRGPPLAGC
jgi:hypothetical protein